MGEVRESTSGEVATARSLSRAIPPPCVARIAFTALSALRFRAYLVGMGRDVALYHPRAAEHRVLYRVIDEHLEAFLEAVARHPEGHRLPKFVEQEFREFLTCGVLVPGFARLRCTALASPPFERIHSCEPRSVRNLRRRERSWLHSECR